MTDLELIELFLQFSSAHDTGQRRQIVDRNPGLLSARMSELIATEAMAFRRRGFGDGADAMERAVDFFGRCRRDGVDAAFAQDHATRLRQIRQELDALVEWLNRSPSTRRDEEAIYARCKLLESQDLQPQDMYVVRLAKACLGLDTARRTASLPMASSVHSELQQLVALISPGTDLHWQARERIAASLALLFDMEQAPTRVDALNRLMGALEREDFPRERWLGLAELHAGFAHANRYKIVGREPDLLRARALTQRAVSRGLDPIDAWNADNLLATVFLQLHERHGPPSDLDAAIEHGERAWVRAPEEGYRHRAVIHLAAALCARYRKVNDTAALNRAIEVQQGSLVTLEIGSAEWCAMAHNLATSQRLRGDDELDEALDLHDRAVKATAESDPQFALYAGGLANALWRRFNRDLSLADLDQAIAIYARAIEHVPRAGMEEVRLLNNRAVALHSRYEIKHAAADLEEAITASKRSLAAMTQSAPAWADTLCNLGGFLTAKYQRSFDEKDFIESVDYLAAASDAMGSSPRRGNLWFSQATALLAHHAVSEAATELDKAIGLLEKALSDGPAPYLVDTYVGALANALATRESRGGDPADAARAQALFDRCLSNSTSLGTYLHLFTALQLADWSFDRAARAEANGGSAEAHWSQAVQGYELTGGIAEQALQVSLDSRHQRDLLQRLQLAPTRHAYACWKLGHVERAVEALEAGRGRLLSQALDVNALSAAGLIAAGRSELARRFTTALQALRVAEHQATVPDETVKNQLARNAARSKLRNELESCVTEIRRVPGFEGLFAPIRVGNIQGTLPGSSKLVYLLVTSAGGLALILSCDAIAAVALSFAMRDLRQLLLPELLGGSSPGYLHTVVEDARDQQDVIERTAVEIGKSLIEPLRSHLLSTPDDASHDKPSLYLILTGTLSVLPLHAAATTDAHLALIDRFAVSLLPSARFLNRPARPSHPDPGSLLVVGDPRPIPVQNEGRLSGARFEARSVARLSKGNALLLLDSDASANAVLAAWRHVETVHLACHGTFDPDVPMRSRLSLASNDELSLGRIVADQTSYAGPHHVVMSACQTALNDFAHLPEEVIGFPAAFLQCGAETVVGTLWSVGDVPSGILMAKYRMGTNAGATAARGLSDAQCWMRDAASDQILSFVDDLLADSPRSEATAFKQRLHDHLASDKTGHPFRSPKYWAGFVCWGRIW